MTTIPFLKMHGLGNDFIVVDRRKNPIDPSVEQLCWMADRRFGIGCDQIVFIDPPESAEADIFMRIRNADGSDPKTCGNASRCLALLESTATGKESVIIDTEVGILRCKRLPGEDRVTVDMGPPRLDWDKIPVASACDTLHLPLTVEGYADPVGVSMGNPHCVFFVDDMDKVDLAHVGPLVEHHSFFPQRTNVEFVQKLGPEKLRMRVWERGTGITSACGTGACGTLVAAVRRGIVPAGAKVDIVLDGGVLTISWDGKDGSVLMTGPAVTAFSGTFEL